MTFTVSEFRAALGHFPTGVAIVTMREPDGRLQGVTVNSFNSVSLDPSLVLFSIAKNALSFAAWEAATTWGISILAEGQHTLSRRFAQSKVDKWSDLAPIEGAAGVPLIAGALAHFECDKYAFYAGGDHSIMIGKVVSLTGPAASMIQPLVYFAGGYHQIHKTDLQPAHSSRDCDTVC